jgi:hypothetical protein
MQHVQVVTKQKRKRIVDLGSVITCNRCGRSATRTATNTLCITCLRHGKRLYKKRSRLVGGRKRIPRSITHRLHAYDDALAKFKGQYEKPAAIVFRNSDLVEVFISFLADTNDIHALSMCIPPRIPAQVTLANAIRVRVSIETIATQRLQTRIQTLESVVNEHDVVMEQNPGSTITRYLMRHDFLSAPYYLLQLSNGRVTEEHPNRFTTWYTRDEILSSVALDEKMEVSAQLDGLDSRHLAGIPQNERV